MRRLAALIGRFSRWLGRFNAVIVVGVALFLGLVIGLGAWGGFNVVADATSSTAFCTSCHEMRTPQLQYEHSLHYLNPFGVRAQCADCHVPKPFVPRVIHMVLALNDIWGHMTGIIDTPAKFQAHKLAMQQSVWKEMTDDDSSGCRSCHSFEAMDFASQPPAASLAMHPAMKAGATCISCHHGVVHELSVALAMPASPAAPSSGPATAISSPAQLLPVPPKAAAPSAPAVASAPTAVDADPSKLYAARCGRCHAAPAPDGHLAGEWPGLVASMQARASLSDQQAATIVKYLQAHAKVSDGQKGGALPAPAGNG